MLRYIRSWYNYQSVSEGWERHLQLMHLSIQSLIDRCQKTWRWQSCQERRHVTRACFLVLSLSLYPPFHPYFLLSLSLSREFHDNTAYGSIPGVATPGSLPPFRSIPLRSTSSCLRTLTRFLPTDDTKSRVCFPTYEPVHTASHIGVVFQILVAVL